MFASIRGWKKSLFKRNIFGNFRHNWTWNWPKLKIDLCKKNMLHVLSTIEGIWCGCEIDMALEITPDRMTSYACRKICLVEKCDRDLWIIHFLPLFAERKSLSHVVADLLNINLLTSPSFYILTRMVRWSWHL